MRPNLPPPHLLVITLALALLVPRFSRADPAPAPIRRAAAGNGLSVSLAWLPPVEQTQNQVWTILAKKAGVAVESLVLPIDAPLADDAGLEFNLPQWRRERLRAVGRDPKKLAVMMAENLREAAQLSASDLESARRQSLPLAQEVAILAAMRLKDPILCARVFEGFVLPFLQAAPDRSSAEFFLSKKQILQDVCSAYRQSGEAEKLFEATAVLVIVAEKEGDTESADWARIKLAEGLAARKRYQDAINALKAVTTPHLVGAQKYIPDLIKLRDAPKAAPAISTEPEH